MYTRIEELKDLIKELQPYEDNWTGDTSRQLFEGEVVDMEEKIGELEDAREELADLLNKNKTTGEKK